MRIRVKIGRECNKDFVFADGEVHLDQVEMAIRHHQHPKRTILHMRSGTVFLADHPLEELHPCFQEVWGHRILRVDAIIDYFKALETSGPTYTWNATIKTESAKKDDPSA